MVKNSGERTSRTPLAVRGICGSDTEPEHNDPAIIAAPQEPALRSGHLASTCTHDFPYDDPGLGFGKEPPGHLPRG